MDLKLIKKECKSYRTNVKLYPRDFLELKDEYIPKLDDNFVHVGIHVRGGDILGLDNSDGREIHPP